MTHFLFLSLSFYINTLFWLFPSVPSDPDIPRFEKFLFFCVRQCHLLVSRNATRWFSLSSSLFLIYLVHTLPIISGNHRVKARTEGLVLYWGVGKSYLGRRMWHFFIYPFYCFWEGVVTFFSSYPPISASISLSFSHVFVVLLYECNIEYAFLADGYLVLSLMIVPGFEGTVLW